MNSMSNSMDSSQIQIERDCVFGGLFQQIIFEMKNSAPLWDDLTTKSTKLHSCLRTTLQALTGFLEAFQKIADAATATKGATKDLGTALTRICLRHKAIEAKMKTFTSSFLDCLIIPLQERLEEWKKTTTHLDKEHAKEYKRARGELKKRSMETLRLQKKLKKGTSNGGTLPRSGGHHGHHHQHSSDMNSLPGGNRESNRVLELALRDTAEKKQAFEDGEKNAIRNALIEERSRFCLFVSYLKPVVDEEVAMLYELTHVQEAMLQLEKHAADPFALPPASEQVIADLKGSADGGGFCFQTPPSSPSSLGSRKSSMCSISSANSSSSSSAHSPSHQIHQRTILNKSKCHPVGATIRYSSVSSQDSGFTSQDALFSRMPYYDRCKGGNQSEGSNPSSSGSSNSSTPSSPYPPGSLVPTTNATWPNLQDSIQFERAACAIMNDRPHTISSAYERGHQRPPLTVYTFQGPMDGHGNSSSTTPATTPLVEQNSQQAIYQSRSEIYGVLGGRKGESKPPVPKRGSSLERGAPGYSASSRTSSSSSLNTPALGPKASRGSKEMKKEAREVPLPDFNQSSDDMIVPQPVYVNMHELNQMASARRQLQQQQQQQDLDLPPPPPELMPPPPKVEVVDGRGGKSEGSLASSGYGSQGQIVMVGAEEVLESEDLRIRNGVCKCFAGGSSGYCTLPRNARHFTHCPLATSKHRNTVGLGSQGVVYGHLRVGSRRNSCGNQEKPPPPVRRNSAISSPAPSRGSSIPSSPIPHHVHQSMSVYTGNSSSSLPGTSSIDSSETTPHASMEQLPPPPAYLITAEQRAAILLQQQEDSRRISVAETIKSLTEKNHQPVSPNMVRKNLRQDEKSSSEQSGSGTHNNSPASPSSRSNSSSRRGSQGNTQRILEEAAKTRATIMQVLNQKLANAQCQPTYGNLGQSPPNHVQPNHGQQHPQQLQQHQQNQHHQPMQHHQPQQHNHQQHPSHQPPQQHQQHQNHNNAQSNYSPQYVHKPQPLPPQPPQSLPPQQNNYGHHPQSQQPNYPSQQPNQQHYQQQNSNYSPHSNHQQNNYSGQQHISYNQHPQSNSPGNSYGQHQQGQNSHYTPQSVPYNSQPSNNSYSHHPPPGQYQNNSYNNHPSSPPFVHTPQPGTPPNVTSPQQQHQQPIYERVDSNPLPRSTPRRFSEELLKSTATFVQNRVLGTRTPPPVMTSKEIFVQTLNAKLSAMRAPSPDRTPPRTQPRNNMSNNNSFAAKLAGAMGHHGGQGPPGKGNSVGEISTALRVRQWISSKTVSDPNICRESLMDQIRRGKKLRTTRAVNDRSAPRIQ